MSSTDQEPDVRVRLVRLLEYLMAVRALRERPVRDVRLHEGGRWWEADLPEHPACRLLFNGTEDAWLRVSKVELPSAPPAPDSVGPFVKGNLGDPNRQPTLIDNVEEQLKDDVDRYVEVVEAFEAYVSRVWEPWAAQARLAWAARRLYEQLYELRLRLQREEGVIELVWGHGVLSWKTGDATVMHPLLLTRMRIGFDMEQGDVTVIPESSAANLDIDLLQGLGLKGFDLLVELREKYRDDPSSPFDPEVLDIYKQLLNTLPDGHVVPGARPPEPGSSPILTPCWCLFVRPRSTMYARFFQSLRERLLRKEEPVPPSLAPVVADKPSELPGDGAEQWRAIGEQLLMPLPTNAEQQLIAERLSQHRGVSVQGPPGTGKTHTIANLISHLVAHGKRVLVTSHKEQPLSVLRDKIPEELRTLCVSVLTESGTSLGQLDQAVQGIYEKAVGLDREHAAREIHRLDADLQAARSQVASLRHRVRKTVEQERATYRLGNEALSASALARWIAAESSRLGFIPDVVQPEVPCPLASPDFRRLWELARDVATADRTAALEDLPDPLDLPTGEQLAGLWAELAEVRGRLADLEGTIRDWQPIEASGRDALNDLADELERSTELLVALESGWLSTLREEIARNEAWLVLWRQHTGAWRAGVEEIATWRNSLAGHEITLPEEGLPGKDILERLQNVHARMTAGKGVSKLFHRDLHAAQQGCRVDREVPRTAPDVLLCITEVRLRRCRYELVTRWNQEVVRIGGEQVEADVPHPEFILDERVGLITGALDWETQTWPALRERLSKVCVVAPVRPSSNDLRELVSRLRTAGLRFREREISDYLASTRSKVAAGCACRNASALWQRLLCTFDGQRWVEWQSARTEADRLRRVKPDVETLVKLHAALAPAAPAWAERILSARGETGTAGDPELALPAWDWRCAETWLTGIIEGENLAELQHQLESQLTRVSRLVTELASESAWLALASRLTDAERQALTAWAQALKKAGKRTGRYANRWITVAQQSMKQAQGAIPVWIMPVYRVVESFDGASAPFDVVIMDESSQCDLFSLAVLGLADKAVIVGDDKQISPQAIGVEQHKVHELISQHISDLPHAELLDVTSSAYDIAKRTYPGVIMLREHFRCLPEIIEFSNALSYNGDILPLREESADPEWQPVVDAFIADGFKEPGTDVNTAEADFITAKIVDICKDPRYAGKTIGVISLLADAQAAAVQKKLREVVGEREMERRAIRCGNAYHFQGDERDVMFVSMVVGGEDRIGAMTKESDRQRINVAASRAKDQLWCVHSVRSDAFHADDVRGRLIRYCENPYMPTYVTLEEKCESDFERHVLRHLLARGLTVAAQHRVGRFRIDFVVKGPSGRLAIECDGDIWHGPERWEADWRRQEILERLGWRFYRLRGSAFYRNPEAALAGLWERLEQMRAGPNHGRPEPQPKRSEHASATSSPRGPQGVSRGTAVPLPEQPPARQDGPRPAQRAKEPVGDVTPGGNAEGAVSEQKGEPRQTGIARSAEPSGDSGLVGSGSPPTSSKQHAKSSFDPQRPYEGVDWAKAQAQEEQLEREGAFRPLDPQEDREKARTESLPFAENHNDQAGPIVGAGVVVQPYGPWAPRALPDARAAELAAVIEALVEIVAAEGPVLAGHAYELYVRASGGHRVGKTVRHQLNRACAAAVRQRRLCQLEDGARGQGDRTLRLPSQPDVVVRARGDRELEHIPKTEVALLARQLRAAHPDWSPEELKRSILQIYDRSRLTAPASRYLDECIALAQST